MSFSKLKMALTLMKTCSGRCDRDQQSKIESVLNNNNNIKEGTGGGGDGYDLLGYTCL